MSYENPNVVTYNLSALTANKTIAIQGPKGKKGRVLEVAVSPTTTYNVPGDGAEAKLEVGTAATPAQFATLGYGTTAAADVKTGSRTSGALANAVIGSDTKVQIKYTHTTGTGAAGASEAHVTIGWE